MQESPTYLRLIEQAQQLEPDEQLHLLEALAASLRQTLQPRSLMQLRGLGKPLWENTDVESYLNQEREAWDG
jgi:hypothetical protein